MSAYCPSQHYGENHFLRPGGAQGSLDVRKDTFARRVEVSLHRLALANNTRIFPVGYINGLIAFKEDLGETKKRPLGQIALEYALTDDARERIIHAESELASMIDVRLTVTPSGAQYLSARAIADLLGFSRVTVITDWTKRPDMLPEAGALVDARGVVDTYYALEAFSNFATWVHPGRPNPTPLTAG